MARADAVHVVVDVHAIGHGLLVAVFHDQVLVEEAEGLLAGRGGQADEVGIEVLQHLAPQVVDAAVGFVGDDDVEGLDGEGGVVGDGLGLSEQVAQSIHALLVVFGRQLAALEHAEQPLDGADGDARREVELVALQVLDDVFLAELVVVVGRAVLVELFLGLAAQVAAVHQKQHAPGAGELDQAVDEADGGEGLAAAGGHLDQGARLVGLERVLQVADGDDLRRPQAGFDERRQGLQAGEEGGGNAWSGAWAEAGAGVIGRAGCGGAGVHGGGRLPARLSAAAGQVLQPVGQGLGPVEGKHGTGAGLRVQALGEVGFDAGGFVAEGQGPHPGGQRGRQALGVAGGLHLHAGEGGALFFGLDHAGGFGVDVKQIVGKAVAGVQGKFADRHATGGVDVGVRHVADMPAGRSKKRVDGLSRPGLRCHACAPLLRLILGEPRGLRAARSAGRRGATALSSPHCPSGG
jgi:hypothetical protein